MIETNQFIDGVNLTDKTSLIHLLSNDDRDDSDDNNEPDMIKQSSYYGDSEFSKLLNTKAGLSILSVNIITTLLFTDLFTIIFVILTVL